MARRQKGTGSVWQDKNKKNLWHGEIQIGTYPNGKPKKKRVSGSSSKAVKTKLEEIKLDYLTDNLVNDSALTVPQIARQLADEKMEMNLLKQTSYNRRLKTVDILDKGALANIPISKLTQEAVRQYLTAQSSVYSNSVLTKLYREINAALKRAVKLNVIRYNLLEDIPCPKSAKPTKKVNALTIGEQKEVIEALNTDKKEPHRTMLLLSMFTGMRMGEICALSLDDYNPTTGKININKTLTRGENDEYILGDTAKTTAGSRVIAVTKTVQSLLSEYIDTYYTATPDDTLFSCKGKFLTTSQVNLYYKRLIERYKISLSSQDYNQHQLRHTYATRCIESGMNAKVLQHKLGHADITVTLNTYADVFNQFEDKEDDKVSSYLEQNGLKL